MGRKTFESLGKVLPNRHHVVMTRNFNFKYDDSNVEILNNIEQLEKYIKSTEECFVIGGEEIYKLLMAYANKIFVTKINESFKADSYFPKINNDEWRIIEVEQRNN